MPFFIKQNKIIYFCHIPKCAGSSLYYAFAEAGWSIFNVQKRLSSDSTYMTLLTGFGIDSSKTLSSPRLTLYSSQHAPYSQWKNWCKADSSFAILRDPVERFKSAIKYQYPRLNRKFSTPTAYSKFILRLLKFFPYSSSLICDLHFLPQHKFCSPDTILYSFSGDWKSMISSQYQLNSIPLVNRSAPEFEVSLTRSDISFLKSFYRLDYKLIDSCTR